MRQTIAESGFALARDLEAGCAVTPFQEKLSQLQQREVHLPVRVAILSTKPENAYALLSEIVGHDYNVCKVVVPARLGYSEIHLQERGFLIDTGSGAQEFDDVGSFMRALEETHLLAGSDEVGLEPLRIKLKGPAHLSGLCLLIPHSLNSLERKPALLSTLADQTDWVFLAGDQESIVSSPHRQMIQIVLNHVTGLQSVLIPGSTDVGQIVPAEEWWKGWKVVLSLGLVHQGTEVLRSRLALLTAPQSELRQYLVESRLLRQLETTLTFMEEGVQQSQLSVNNRIYLGREALLSSGADLRKGAEAIRARLAETCENLLRTADREARAALAPDGVSNCRLIEAAQVLSTDDIHQTIGETTIKLSLSDEMQRRLTGIVNEIGRERFALNYNKVRESMESSLLAAEVALTELADFRYKLSLELPDEGTLLHEACVVTGPEVRYRGEMPRPTLATRFQSARQGIMGLAIMGSVLGGVATLSNGNQSGSGDIRTILYALMLPMLILGFLWTYVSFRKKERLILEKEGEKLRDGVSSELRRAQQELFREQQTALSSALQRSLRAVHQQIEGAIEKVQALRQRESEDARKRQSEQQRSLEQRVARLRHVSQQLTILRNRLSESQKLQREWLTAWIEQFNKGQT